MKKTRAIVFLTVFITAVFVIYWNIDSNEPTYNQQLTLIDDRINVLEKDIKETQVLLETIKSYVRRLAKSYERRALPPNKVSNYTIPESQNWMSKVGLLVSKESCPGDQAISDVKVSDMVASLPFDNPDGGVWKQGFEITPKLQRWTEQRPLEVFVVPHSHTDPGWVKTFTKYYEAQTKNILDTMLVKLEQDKSRKFIYAELVFFALWWSELNDGDRQKVRKLISSGRLELVGGGWVMPDEAVTSYYGVLDQLQEGHSWLKRNLDLEVKSSWAIDPFGHSPTIAYMQKMAGLQGGVLQRVHYVLKKQLAKDKNLEFFWRQQWDDIGETDFLSHMMPFYSYDIPHTCGPNPSVCCQFDFNRIAGVSKIRCPWNIQPVRITDSNVEERSAMLVDQYRQKAELFRTNSLFIPVGDDFRWETPAEWDSQMENYGRLFDTINSHKEWHVKIKWATLNDYLTSVAAVDRTTTAVDSLSGDFFTYADRDQHYWSGYFTSRPFQKRFARVVESQQRAADILYSMAMAECEHYEKEASNKPCQFPLGQLMHQLTNGRRNLALFQHHDGISGTAKDFVVEDYGIRLHSAFQDARYVQQVASSYLLLSDKSLFLSGDHFNVLVSLDVYQTHDSLPEVVMLRPEESSPRWLTVFNSLGWRRNTLIRFVSSTPNVSITLEHNGKTVPSEAFPQWTSTDQMSSDSFLIVFEVDLAPLSIAVYRVEVVNKAGPMHSYGTVVLYNSNKADEVREGPFLIKRVTVGQVDTFMAKNALYKAEFCLEKGTLKSLAAKDFSMDISVKFMSYGAKAGKDRSGAYLFIPDETDPQPVKQNVAPLVRLTSGRLMTEVSSFLVMVEHRYSMLNLTSYSDRRNEKLAESVLSDLQISNIVDIRGVQTNFELAMRIESALKSENVFYTDLNGFQMNKRVRYDKLSLQGNFYPVTTAITIEDTSPKSYASKGLRLTLLTAQSAGGSSPKSGAIEIVTDRRLLQDDNRGLAQPMKDNRRTEAIYRLILERRSRTTQGSMLRMSLPAHHHSLDMQYNALVMPIRSTLTLEQISQLAPYQPLGQSAGLPCDLHLVSFRPLQADVDSRKNEASTKTTPSIEPTRKPLISFHRLLAENQCENADSDETPATHISVCSLENNSTKLASLFSKAKQSVSKSRFEPVLLSGHRSEMLLAPSDYSLQSVISPGHIRSFLISFS